MRQKVQNRKGYSESPESLSVPALFTFKEKFISSKLDPQMLMQMGEKVGTKNLTVYAKLHVLMTTHIQ